MRYWKRLVANATALVVARSAGLWRPPPRVRRLAGFLRAALVAVALSLPATSHASSVLVVQQQISNGIDVTFKIDNYASSADFANGIIASTDFMHPDNLYHAGYSMLGLTSDPTGGYQVVQKQISNGIDVTFKIDNYASYADFANGIIASTDFMHPDNLYHAGYSMFGLTADPTGGYQVVQQQISNGIDVTFKVDHYASYADLANGIIASTYFMHPDNLYHAGYSMLGLTFDLARGQTGIPEPASWALMVLGFGAVGWGLRRSGRRHAPVVSRRL